jgi:hypothetical protein
MATYRVTCREKHSLYERIISIGCVEVGTGSTQRFTEDEAINRIEKAIDSYYVERPNGHRVKVIIAEREGRRYLKTEADGEKPDNLLALPNCPPKKPDFPATKRTIVAAASHAVELSSSWYTRT